MNNSETATAAAIRAWAERRRLPEAQLERWLQMEAAGRAALLEIARQLRIRTGQMVAAIGMLDEIALATGQSPASILASAQVRRAIESSGSAPARAAGFLEALRGLRFPRLSRIRAALESEIRALALPRGLNVRLPRELASDELVVELRVRTGHELNQSMEALVRCRIELARIVERLGGGGDEL